MRLKSKKKANCSKSIHTSKQLYILYKKLSLIKSAAYVSSWNVDCYSIYFADKGQDLNNYKKNEIEQEPFLFEKFCNRISYF